MVQTATAAREPGKKRPVNIDGVMFPYDDAKQEVRLKRTLAHVLAASPGSTDRCMNGNCVMDPKYRRLFPHRVLGVSVIKTKVYVIDSVSPPHAVRYTLGPRDSALIMVHDTKALGQPGELRLRVPKGTDRAGMSHRTDGTAPVQGRKTKKPGSKKRTLRGEAARVMAALMGAEAVRKMQTGGTNG